MRLDQALVSRGLADSRARAKAQIDADLVTVDGVLAVKASQKVTDGSRVELIGPPMPWVSRAALKLVHGLDHFGVAVAGRICLDIGASTGGFTEVLCAREAAQVFALDVGHGQLHARVAADPRVVDMCGVNARKLPEDALPPLDLLVCDVSFVSLEKALPLPLSFARPGADLVALIKPQFEVGPSLVGKGGIVRDAVARQDACDSVTAFLKDMNWQVDGLTDSPITGSDGNVEYLVRARRALP